MTRKRRQSSKDDPANLKRFRDEIMHLSEPSSKSEHFQHDRSEFANFSKKKLPRKMKRKEERHLKKSRRQAYNQRKPMPKPEEQQEKKKKEVLIEQKQKKLEKLKKKKKKSKERKQRILNEEEDRRKEEMHAAIQREEKSLRQLEKQLHLNKRKSKNLPQSFLDDGLDYLLDIVDKDKVTALYDDSDLEEDIHKKSGEKDSNDSDQDLSDDQMLEEDDEKDELKKQAINDIMSHFKKSGSKLTTDQVEAKSILKSSSKSDKTESKRSKVKFKDIDNSDESESHDEFSDEDKHLDESDFSDSDEDDESEVTQIKQKIQQDSGNLKVEEDSESDDDFSSEDENLVDDEDEEEEDDLEENNENKILSEDIETSDINKDKSDPSLKEDIYGRLRDSKGNVVTKTTGSYVPPGKRQAMANTMDEKIKLKVERLKKQLKGLINRASESNMGPICSQIETLYTTSSRGDVNESLCEIILEACVASVLTPERLVMELMMLVAILNDNVGMEVGGLFIQELALRLKASWEDIDGKYLDNVILLFAHLYNFKVLHCVLVFDIIRKLVDKFTEKDIELILLLLKNVGFSLRKDDPHTLKDVILLIQGKATQADTTNSTRVRFMLEVLLAIKNNNMRKIPNYDPEQFEQMKKSARNHIKGSLGSNQLRIGLEDLMNAKDKGRWWVVGSAWEGRSEAKEDPSEKVQTTVLGEMSSKILELARKQRMNTGIRKSIFCVIMTSEDYIDAFEKLLRLGLKNQQEREIIHVITDCCIQEKSFNPFYAFLVQKFCEYDRRFQMTFQFLLWDKFKEMSHQSEQSRHHLGKLVSHLLASKATSLSVFKVVEFGTLDKNMVRFLKQVLQEILLDYPDHVIQDVFSRIAPLTKLHLLQEGLKLFMRHFIVGKKSKHDQDKMLIEQVSLAEKSLSGGQSKMEL